MSEKVEYDQYAVFAEQRHLNNLNYSVYSIRGEAEQNAVYCLYIAPNQLARVYNRQLFHDTNHWEDILPSSTCSLPLIPT